MCLEFGGHPRFPEKRFHSYAAYNGLKGYVERRRYGPEGRRRRGEATRGFTEGRRKRLAGTSSLTGLRIPKHHTGCSPCFKSLSNILGGRLKMICQADHHLMPVEVKDGSAGGNGGWNELLGF